MSVMDNKARLLMIFTGLMLIGILVAIVGAGKVFSHSRPITQSELDRYVTVHDAQIRYRQSGTGQPTIILLHGFGGSLDGWHPIQSLLDTHTVIALDLVGFGGSDKPAIHYGLETHRQYLLAFLDKLNIQQAVLVGGSMGGSVAIWTAAHSPERVTGLVLIAPSGYPGSLKKFPPYSWFYKPGLANSIASLLVSNGLYRWLYPQSIARQALNVTSTYNHAFADILPRVKQPTLLAWSTGDKTAQYDFHRHYIKSMPQAEFVPLPAEYAHKVIRKDPAGTAKLINRFVTTLTNQ